MNAPRPSKCTPGCSRIKISVISQKSRQAFCLSVFLLLYGEANHVRTARWAVREPARTLVNTFIFRAVPVPFIRASLPAKNACESPLEHQKGKTALCGLSFLTLTWGLEGSGVRKRAGGTFPPRPGPPAGGRVPAGAPKKQPNGCFRR